DITTDANAVQPVADGLLQQKPHRALGLRTANIKSLWRDLRRCFFVLHEDVVDLRSVAVLDDQLVAVTHDLGEPSSGLLPARDLLLLCAAILGTEQRVAAERHDGEFGRRGHARGPREREASSCSAVRLARATVRDRPSG